MLRHHEARPGSVRQGVARPGEVRRGKGCLQRSAHSMSGLSGGDSHHAARSRTAWQGEPWRGRVWHGLQAALSRFDEAVQR